MTTRGFAKTSVTVLRRSAACPGAASRAPQERQVVRPGGFSCPQVVHGSAPAAASDASSSRTVSSASEVSATSRYAWIGSLMPFGVNGGTVTTWTRSRVSAYVDGAMSASLAGAFCSMAVARRTTSPVSTSSPARSSPAATWPVAMPVRTSSRTPNACSNCSFRFASVRRLSAAAATPRSASCSCSTGSPKTATRASPMIFSIRPPCASKTSCISSK